MPEPVDIDPTDREEMGEEDDEWGADLMNDMNDMNDLNDIYIYMTEQQRKFYTRSLTIFRWSQKCSRYSG